MGILRKALGLAAAACALTAAVSAQQPAQTGQVAQSAITPPVRIVETRPVYTPEAARARIQGDVELGIEILADGSVGEVRVLRSLDRTYGLDEKAIEAVRQWRFKPATRDGVAVTVRVPVRLSFTLRDRNGEPIPLVTPNAWPEPFGGTAALSTDTSKWRAASITTDAFQVSYAAPDGWISGSGSGSNGLLFYLSSADFRQSVSVGTFKAPPVQMSLPFNENVLRQFADGILRQPTGGKMSYGSIGQVQVGTRWWLWIELMPSATMLEQMPPPLRMMFAQTKSAELSGWSFITFEGGTAIQAICTTGLPAPGPERDVERSDAARVFRGVLSKITIGK